jgi:hypothetical protein
MSISSFKSILISQSSIARSAHQRTLLATPHGSALARHLLNEVGEYVRYCAEYDDDPLDPSRLRALAKFQSLAERGTNPLAASDPAYLKDLHAGLRTAIKLMQSHDLWLGHSDPERRVIMSTFGELGFEVADRSLENDPIDPSLPSDDL